MKYLILTVLLAVSVAVSAQQKPAYVLYNAQGKKVSYEKMIRDLTSRDLVFSENTTTILLLTGSVLELCKDLSDRRSLVLGAEMFEADNQKALDQYLADDITAKGLDTLARLWKNYRTDYAPLVNFAKSQHLSFAATNIPRRYAARVSSDGFEALDSLSAEEKAWVAPLPFPYDPEVACYKNMLTMMGPDHASPNFPKAQACKDATMAHFILQYYKPGSLFLHFNGSYHSDNHEGIVWYIRQWKPDMKVATITTVTQNNMNKLSEENKGLADYIICVDEDMTTTY